MSTDRPNLWGASDAYDRYMGRWSREVAPRFLAWMDAPAQHRWLDVGCGTGVLSAAILAATHPAAILAVDTAEGFLDAARLRVTDPRASFQVGDALALPVADGAIDAAVSGLVLNFLPDKVAAVREMVRAVSPGGTVALYVWDYAGHMQIMRIFFDAATELDPGAAAFDDGIKAPICRPGPLRALFESAGLADVDVEAIDVPAAFDTFDDYWTPFLGGTGSAPKYCASLAEDERMRLRETVRQRLPTGPDGEILLAVRAFAVKGRVPSA
jgi:SAM-dependent methyltransferase